jgi:hypothetical protein
MLSTSLSIHFYYNITQTGGSPKNKYKGGKTKKSQTVHYDIKGYQDTSVHKHQLLTEALMWRLFSIYMPFICREQHSRKQTKRCKNLRIIFVYQTTSMLFAISFSTCYRLCKRTALILIRLRGCAGWSGSTMLVLSWRGSFVINEGKSHQSSILASIQNIIPL